MTYFGNSSGRRVKSDKYRRFLQAGQNNIFNGVNRDVLSHGLSRPGGY